jgi:hypothetical protein
MGQDPELPQNEATSFFKTECNHRFHKKCLTDWMKQKHQCPVCRALLPQYHSF